MESNVAQGLMENQTCPAVGYQIASVCVPVTVTPYAQAGTTVTKCCGEPRVTSGWNVCSGVKNGICTFTIAQDICVAVPIDFGAVAEVGDAYVNCNGATSEDVCTNCAVVPPEIPTVPDGTLQNTVDGVTNVENGITGAVTGNIL